MSLLHKYTADLALTLAECRKVYVVGQELLRSFEYSVQGQVNRLRKHSARVTSENQLKKLSGQEKKLG